MNTDTPTCPQCGKPLSANSLMGLCPDCLLQAGFGAVTGEDKAAPFVAPTVEELAERFPQLEILELIGQGGMGAVYSARQKRLERIVAVKILPPAVGHDPSFAERFEREAKALARLHHPNIVTLYEFGEANGLFYFLMEFVDGLNLRHLLNAGRVAPKEALAIVPQICDALQFAHERDIVHRDIKPENILLNKLGQVKIADFGVAKIVAQELAQAAEPDASATPFSTTQAGQILGTPQYMAPEQMAHPLEVDHRADIYALGVVFYQMLTGELPQEKIEPPSHKVQLDVRLDEVVLRALEKNPDLRCAQASIFKTQIETIAAATTPSSPNVPKSESQPRWPRQRLITLGVSLIALALIIELAAIGVNYLWHPLYEAASAGFVTGPNSDSPDTVMRVRDLAQKILDSDPVLKRHTPKVIKVGSSDGLHITAIDGDPGVAMNAASSAAERVVTELAGKSNPVQFPARAERIVRLWRVFLAAPFTVPCLVAPGLVLAVVGLIGRHRSQAASAHEAASRPRGEILASVGAALQIGWVAGLVPAVASLIHLSRAHPGGEPFDPYTLANAIGGVLLLAGGGAAAGLLGLILLSIALTVSRYRSPRFYRFLTSYSWLLLLVVPVGTAFGIFFLVYCRQRRGEFNETKPERSTHAHALVPIYAALVVGFGIAALAIYSKVRTGIAQEEVRRKAVRTLAEGRQVLDHSAAAVMQPILDAWRRNDQSAAIARFIEADWNGRPLFASESSVLGLREKEFAALPSAERNAKSAELNTNLDELRHLVAAVEQAGHDAAAGSDFAYARRCLEALKRCGRALDQSENLLVVRLLGQAMEKKAGAEEE